MQAVAHRVDAKRRAGVRHTREGEVLAFLPKTQSILSLTREIDVGNLIRKSPHGPLQFDGTLHCIRRTATEGCLLTPGNGQSRRGVIEISFGLARNHPGGNSKVFLASGDLYRL
jgi:hypothetical protein